jgi:hypothetical protein
MTNEEILDNLRDETSRIISIATTEPELLTGEADAIREICGMFIQLDISLSYDSGELPGAWGSSKLSKSNLS